MKETELLNDAINNFQSYIKRAIKHFGSVQKVALIVQVSIPTVERWAAGVTAPLFTFRSGTYKILKEHGFIWSKDVEGN